MRFVVLKTPWWQCLAAGVPFLRQPGDSWVAMDPTDYTGPRADETDVIMNPHRAPELARVWDNHPEQVILYEAENLVSARSGWRSRSEVVRRACPRNVWWNYSAVNSKVFGDVWRPLRWADAPRPPRAEPDLDVAFVGSMNARRFELLIRLQKAGLKIYAPESRHGTFGPELEALEARARVVLNVHFYEPGIFESFRVVPAAARGARVVSENSLGGEGAEFCARTASYVELVDTVVAEVRWLA